MDRHHLTGRCNGDYVDPFLVVAMCHNHHELAGEDLRAENLERGNQHSSPVAVVAHRLHCVGVFLARLANGDPDSMWARLAVHVRSWADELDQSLVVDEP